MIQWDEDWDKEQDKVQDKAKADAQCAAIPLSGTGSLRYGAGVKLRPSKNRPHWSHAQRLVGSLARPSCNFSCVRDDWWPITDYRQGCPVAGTAQASSVRAPRRTCKKPSHGGQNH